MDSREFAKGAENTVGLRHLKAAGAAILAACLLTACDEAFSQLRETGEPSVLSQPAAESSAPEIPSAPSPEPEAPAPSAPEPAPEAVAQGYPLLEDGRSDYGRNSLSPEEQIAYDALAAGLLARAGEVEVDLPTPEDLTRLILYVRQDYPIISWMSNQYSYTSSPEGTVERVYLEYTKSPEEIGREIQEVWEAGQALAANIDPSLPEFDRALILYDRLCEHVEYDGNSLNQRNLYGALVEGRATCEGYSKAYQYLLSLMGMEALTVYGRGVEEHAWNIVRLDGEYYHADVTYGDVILPTGDVFLSHAYLFVDDGRISRSHTLHRDYGVPAPRCTSQEQDYFRQKDTLVAQGSWEELEGALDRAMGLALANGYAAAQIRLEEAAVEPCLAYLDRGELDLYMLKLAESKGKSISGRSYDDSMQVLSYLMA